jgi:hypothetical protein
MAIAKTNLSQQDVNVEIDLEKLLGSAAKNQAVQEVFFQAAFDRMLERLDQGVDVNGKALPKYSSAYKKSLEYAAFGKDGTVNMQLTTEMVNSLKIKSDDINKFKIGFEGDVNNAKAYAHMTGYKSHPVLDGKVKPRNFFGWSDKDLKAIASEIKPQNDSKQSVSDAAIIKLLDKLLA